MIRSLRTVPWVAWAATAPVVAGVAWLVGRMEPGSAERFTVLAIGMLLAALAWCFTFDDPAAVLLDPAPTRLWRRRLVRVTAPLVPWLGMVAGLLWGATRGGVVAVWEVPTDPVALERLLQPGMEELFLLPVGRWVLIAATVAAVGLAIAAVISRWTDEPGRIASGALFAVYLGSWLLPSKWRPWLDPVDPGWLRLVRGWWVVLGVALVVAVVASWDARRGRRLGALRNSFDFS